ncbi:CRE-MLTN-2 protein [Caenorhabditis remanei]|uniref:CRE-MLTN-2 protein n=1 Tax=Caenorhabditis remanei TaxID=31234 RepID=E3LLS3_CAERE|nr:CRE-MLTN-2 protein [Caenorhabditis remanei]
MRHCLNILLRGLPIFLVVDAFRESPDASSHLKSLLGDKTPVINTTQDSVLELSNHWIDQAISALIATVANEKISTITHLETRFHEKCVKNIKSVEAHAKCVSDLLHVSRAQNARKKGAQILVKKVSEAASASDWVGSFRIRKKRQTQIVNRSGYSLKSSKDDISPFTLITKQITKSIRALKNKKEERGWRQIMVDVKKTGEVIEKRRKVKEMIGKSVRSRSAKPKKLYLSPRKPLANNDYEALDDPIQMTNEIIQTSSESDKKIDAEELLKRFQDHPEDILNDDAQGLLNMTGQETEAVLRIKLIREAVKLGLSLGGQNVSGFDQKSMKFASPRFFAIAPEEHKKENDTVSFIREQDTCELTCSFSQINILSPSLFSLHDEGSPDEQKTSLVKLLGDKEGIDKDSFMDLLTELTGVADTVDDAAQKASRESEGTLINVKGEEINVSRENLTKVYGEENYRKMKVLEKLHGMYTDEQVSMMNHFNKSGYAIMTDKQRDMVYGSGAPFENKLTLEAGRNLTMPKAKKALHTVIQEIGKGNIKVGKYEKRMKDIVGSPILFSSIIASPATASQALIASPVLFTPLVLSPAIYGSVILSPWVFVPVILGPRILSPIIVSPAIFSPIVLSPLALDPLVLVPGVANPVVLSPFILTPFILSPQVMTPIILSPFALSPFILTPTALSPLILSPFVLSPSVLSPSFVTAVIMSPYALSPSVLSPPTMISVFASPSILS